MTDSMSSSNNSSQEDFSKHDVKIIVDKKTIEKFTQSSPTLNHLTKYKIISSILNYFLNLPILSSILSFFISYNYKFKKSLLESERVPIAVKKSYQLTESFVWKFDEVFNYLVLREGVDNFYSELNKRHYLPGLWLLWFSVDYLANFTDVLLKELIVKPFKLSYITKESKNLKSGSKSKSKSGTTTADNRDSISSNQNKPVSNINGEATDIAVDNINDLPHLQELSNTTRNISKDLQGKLNNNYNSYIKPTTEKLTSLYIDEPKKKLMTQIDSAKSTNLYKTVSGSYEDNFKKSNESIPRALVSTGKDIGSLTLEKLKAKTTNIQSTKEASTKEMSRENGKPKENGKVNEKVIQKENGVQKENGKVKENHHQATGEFSHPMEFRRDETIVNI